MIDVRQHITNGYSGRYPLDPTAVIGIAIHHSVSGGHFYDELPDTQDDEIFHLRVIDQYHVEQGWGGFGYHLAAFPSGRWYYCGDLTGARAHVASRNYELIGVVLIGDFSANVPPLLQMEAAREAVAFVRQTYPGRSIAPHREWALPQYPTACPGDTYQEWVPFLEPLASEEDDMLDVIKGDQRNEVYVLAPSGRKVHILDPAHLQALLDNGFVRDNAIRTIPQAQMEAIPDASGSYL